jgi:3-hydroxyisobutyrate dehydrogenase-like beta-hydroxyacid dehydrogenase
MSKIAFIGIGRMGWHMAAHLAKGGHDVVVCDVVPGMADKWVAENGGAAVASPADAVRGREYVITSLPADRELFAVADGIIAELAKGTVWIDHSTTSAEGSRVVAARVADVGSSFLDAPVSGGVDGARNGTLTVMAGGDEKAFATAETVMSGYAARMTLMGESGAGQITKMTNQICVVGVCQALAEGLDFAETAGLDVQKVIHVMLQGSSASWQMANRAEKMLAGEYNYGFSTTAMGGAQWDWCSLMERQRRRKA